MQRHVDIVHRLPQRFPAGMVHRFHIPGAGQFHPAQVQVVLDPVNFLHRRVDIAIGQAGETDMAIRVMFAEIRQPVVIDAVHLVCGVMVRQLAGRAQDAVQHLGIDTVDFHVLHPQMRVGNPADVLLAVFIQVGRGHQVGPRMGPRYVFCPGRSQPVLQAERDSVPAGPVGAVRPFGDIGHAVLHRWPRLGHKQIRRHPAQIDMAIGGNALVLHNPHPPTDGSETYRRLADIVGIWRSERQWGVIRDVVMA